jgi:RNA recognition motif-containing protein
MATKLYVGSLSYGVDDNQLKDFFSAAGTVVSASVITDKFSGQSKGFGFVEMSSEDEAKEAIKQLNDKELDGRTVTVNEARPREERPSGFGGGQGNNRGGYGGGRRRS